MNARSLSRKNVGLGRGLGRGRQGFRSSSSSSSSFPRYEGLEITRIEVFRADLPLHDGGRYRWAGGKYVDVFDTTVVKVSTSDDGVTGYGENCPLGSNYLPHMCAAGTRAGVQELARHLIGADPTRLADVNRRMDWLLAGHPAAKSCLDMACWDIAGQVANRPVCELLGGRFGESFALYRAISQDTPDAMARSVQRYLEEGYTKFQLKVGNNSPREDIARIRTVRSLLDDLSSPHDDVNDGNVNVDYPLLCDANTGWLRHEAMRVANGIRGLDGVYLEMPCETYEECRSIREHTDLPFVLDECVTDLGMLLRILNDRAADVINLKIGRVGGLTKARVLRDVCVATGIPMNIEDTWGGDITQAAIAALAHSTPPEALFCATDFNSYGPVTIADTTAVRQNGRMAAPIEPGLGVFPRWDVLGDALYDTDRDTRPISECPNKPYQ